MKFNGLPSDAYGKSVNRGDEDKNYPPEDSRFKGIYNFQAFLDNPVNNIDSIINKNKIKRYKFLDVLLPKLLFMNTITGKESKMESTSSVASLLDAISILGKLDADKFYGKYEKSGGTVTRTLLTDNDALIDEKINKYDRTCLITNNYDLERFNTKPVAGCINLGDEMAKGEGSKTGHAEIISLFDKNFYQSGSLLPSPLEADKQSGGGKKKNVRKYSIKYKYLKSNKYANI